ncbi:MAG: transketolase [Propionibacteriaceae bacterium]|nr:transketolase [Propionibacteriaceae bacterium]
MTDLQWTADDQRAVDTAKILAADAVQKAGNGHPGTAISMAGAAYLLYAKVMNLDPADDKWLGRDRFILSSGHASILQYNQLYLGGLGLELDDLKALRTAGSLTPGHPEYGHTKFIEATTGPLGAGVSNAVGMAMAVRRQRHLYDPAASGASVFDHFVYCVTGDGCLQEGVAAEAAALAGVQRLGNLVLIYDDNNITIEGDTKIAFTEDVLARFAAYGWHTQEVSWRGDGTAYREDIPALYDAILKAQTVTDQPSIIKLNTVIAWPSPTMAGSEKTHGAALGADEISRLKALLGFEDQPFAIDEALVGRLRANLAARGAAARAAWDVRFDAWRSAQPSQAAVLDRVMAGQLPDDLTWPAFDADTSTRAASGAVLSALAPQLPELWGGSADLAGSNDTTMKGEPSFLPDDRVSADWPGGPGGRTLHFGIREHAMGGVLNGMNLEGLTRAYGGTFFVFSDYMRPAVRLAALMGVPSIFVWTHDSVGVGEDGPTHQPVEHLAAYRAIPGLAVVRPADANETVVAWREILRRHDGPAALILTRQNVPTVKRGDDGCASADGLAKGGYVLRDATGGAPKVVLIATGSEVSLALAAAATLEAEGTPTRVVSMPCQEWFDEQPADYRAQVLPAGTVRVSVEAGIAMGWAKYLGDRGASVSLEHFGASASGPWLFEQYGFTAAHIVEVVKTLLK